MKKGLTVVFFIFIYFLITTNVFAMENEKVEIVSKQDEIEVLESDDLIETKEENEEKEILEEPENNENLNEEEQKDYLKDLNPVIQEGDFEIVSKEIGEKTYDKSISGEEFEITYNAQDYKALNFYIENNDENQSSVYKVMIDDETIYEEYFEEKQNQEVRLNIDGKLVKLCLKGNGTYIDPYLTTKKNTYTITYDEEKEYEVDSNKYIIEKEEEKDGYIFKYYENIDSKKYYPEDEVYLNNDLSLKSIYEEEKYNVTYSYLGNTIRKTYTINNNNLFIPELEGYTFLGWFDKDGNKINSLTKGNIDLFAKLKKIETPIKKSSVSRLNYTNNIINTTTNITNNTIENKDNNIKNKAVSIEQIETPFNSKTIKINYIFIIGILIILIAVFTIFKFSLK